jgi:hypothetical protein
MFPWTETWFFLGQETLSMITITSLTLTVIHIQDMKAIGLKKINFLDAG